MEIRELVERAFQRDLSDPSALFDAFDSIRLLEPEDFKLAHEKTKRYVGCLQNSPQNKKASVCSS